MSAQLWLSLLPNFYQGLREFWRLASFYSNSEEVDDNEEAFNKNFTLMDTFYTVK